MSDKPDIELNPDFVIDDDEHADLDHPDIGDPLPDDEEQIPDDLDEGDLDDLLAEIEREEEGT